MITDGISRQVVRQSGSAQHPLTEVSRMHGFTLALLHILAPNKHTSLDTLRGELMEATGKVYESLELGMTEHMAAHMVSLMCKVLVKLLPLEGAARDEAVLATPAVGSIYAAAAAADGADMVRLQKQLPQLTGALGTDWETAAKEGAGGVPKMMYAVSKPEAALPRLERVVQAQVQARNGAAERAELHRRQQLAAAREQLQQWEARVAAGHGELLRLAERCWSEAEERVASSAAQDLVAALEEAVLPANRYTRRQATARGTQLYLPGLIKALISDFQYKKIFAVKSAGGQRNYSVAILVDRSLSMMGHLLKCAVQTLMLLRHALAAAGVDALSVLSFGHDVRLLKTEEMEWGAAAMLSILAELARPEHELAPGTQDALAVEYALDLVQESDAKRKLVFVLTDGYSTSGLQLQLALARAQELDVDVVALGVGLDRVAVGGSYAKWATATLPAALHDALRALYEQDAEEPAAAAEWDDKELEKWAAVPRGGGGEEVDVAALLANPQVYFPQVQQQLQRERTAVLERGGRGNMSVDLCFVLDCTGSMAPFIAVARQQIHGVATSLRARLAHDFPGVPVAIRTAAVCYRDFGDAPQREQRDFAIGLDADVAAQDADAQAMLAWLGARAAFGGDDEAEDVLGALDAAAGLSWRARGRFIVLVTDAPGHGREMGCDVPDKHPGAHPHGKTLQGVLAQLRGPSVRAELLLVELQAGQLRRMHAALSPVWQAAKPTSRVLLPPVALLPESRKAPVAAMHIVFVLDGSGSMSGEPWRQLMVAYRKFLQQRGSMMQGRCQDVFSAVVFDSSAKECFRLQGVRSVPQDLDEWARWGGTTYCAGLRLARECLAKNPPNFTPCLIFMSDGAPGDGSAAESMIGSMARERAGLQVFTLGFGNSSFDVLRRMATCAGGKFMDAPDGASLVARFEEMAQLTHGVDAVVGAVTSQVAEQVANHIADTCF